MAAKQIACPRECEDKHSEHRITMTEIKGDLKYIKEKLDENTLMIKDVIDKKAEKEQLQKLEDKFKNLMLILGTVALSIIGYLVIKWVEGR
jgi:hypothetical protein